MYDETTNPAAFNPPRSKKEAEAAENLKNAHDDSQKDDSLVPTNGVIPNKDADGIFLEQVTAKWIGEQSDNTLTDINLSVIPGKLTAIIGPVGAGKVFSPLNL